MPGALNVILPPAAYKRTVLLNLPDELNIQARELAGRRSEPLARVLTALLTQAVPQALAAERERSDWGVGPSPPVIPEEAAGGGAQ